MPRTGPFGRFRLDPTRGRVALALANLTGRELGRRQALPHSTIARWLRGESRIRADRLERLADALAVSPEFLLSAADRRRWRGGGPR